MYYLYFFNEVCFLLVMLVCVCMFFFGKEDLKYKNKFVGMCCVIILFLFVCDILFIFIILKKIDKEI